jgi:phosphoribosyl-dephospho-CoA transferase
MTPALRRHQLVWLDGHAWHRVWAAASAPTAEPLSEQTAQALECLAHWACQRWPLVVTRQACGSTDGSADLSADDALALGLSAPAVWGRQAIKVTASLQGVTRRGEFPDAAALLDTLPAAAQAGWRQLCQQLAQLDAPARVYGSHGWQQLTGLAYVHDRSDIDLLVDVGSAAQADRVGAVLRDADTGPLRIDGELVFDDGAAVAWREWLQLRSGQTERILVKRLASTTLEDASAWAACA